MPSPDTPKKIRYTSRSVEVHVDRPRTEVWPDVVAMVEAQGSSTALSVEPPWRLVYEVPTDATVLSFWQSTVLIRDDGPTCHVAWGIVFDPDPSAEVVAAADVIVDGMRTALRGLTGPGARADDSPS
ncbi:MAG: hypothetical protein AAGC53_14580 [Actinomycetota bacterium]